VTSKVTSHHRSTFTRSIYPLCAITKCVKNLFQEFQPRNWLFLITGENLTGFLKSDTQPQNQTEHRRVDIEGHAVTDLFLMLN